MNYRTGLIIVTIALALTALLTACGGDTAPAPTSSPTPTAEAAMPAGEATSTVSTPPEEAPPSPTGTPIDTVPVMEPPTPDEDAPTPTQVTSTGTGAELTALQALKDLQGPALAWQADARLGLLANTRPGREKDLLGGTLGDPNIFEPTPGGKGRNWILIAFSPSANDAVAIAVDGTQIDLVESGSVTDDVIQRFSGPGTEALALSTDIHLKLVDSDEIATKAGDRGSGSTTGIALLSPNGLGLGPLPVPTGNESPQIAYELFSSEGGTPSFIFYDAMTGAVVLDSQNP